MYLSTVRGDTYTQSLISSSFTIRSSLQSGFSLAILRINARSSVGIGGRPAVRFQRKKSRAPNRCLRIMVAGRTMITASRQSNSLENNARLIRVAQSARRA